MTTVPANQGIIDPQIMSLGASCLITKAVNGERSISDVPIMRYELSLEIRFLDGENPRPKLSLKRRPRGDSIAAVSSCLTCRSSMRLSLEMFVYLAFLLAATCGLPIPNDNNHSMVPFAIIPLACSRWGRSLPEDRSSATEWRPIGWPRILGGTPANTSICRYPAQWDGKMWWIMCSAALALIVLYGVLAFVMWGIMSVDLPRLIVWNRTGEERRR